MIILWSRGLVVMTLDRKLAFRRGNPVQIRSALQILSLLASMLRKGCGRKDIWSKSSAKSLGGSSSAMATPNCDKPEGEQSRSYDYISTVSWHFHDKLTRKCRPLILSWWASPMLDKSRNVVRPAVPKLCAARLCQGRQEDMWTLYLGNSNEVLSTAIRLTLDTRCKSQYQTWSAIVHRATTTLFTFKKWFCNTIFVSVDQL